MKVIETLLGNSEDPAWKARLENARVDVLSLDQWQAQKNRFRRKTDGGIDLAVSLERNIHLHDGDVLFWDNASRLAIITRIQLKDVMVIRLGRLALAGSGITRSHLPGTWTRPRQSTLAGCGEGNHGLCASDGESASHEFCDEDPCV